MVSNFEDVTHSGGAWWCCSGFILNDAAGVAGLQDIVNVRRGVFQDTSIFGGSHCVAAATMCWLCEIFSGDLIVARRNTDGGFGAAQGGGLFVRVSGHSQISRSEFYGNSAYVGGGVALRGPGTHEITLCIFIGNVARGGGGGIDFQSEGPLAVTAHNSHRGLGFLAKFQQTHGALLVFLAAWFVLYCERGQSREPGPPGAARYQSRGCDLPSVHRQHRHRRHSPRHGRYVGRHLSLVHFASKRHSGAGPGNRAVRYCCSCRAQNYGLECDSRPRLLI